MAINEHSASKVIDNLLSKQNKVVKKISKLSGRIGFRLLKKTSSLVWDKVKYPVKSRGKKLLFKRELTELKATDFMKEAKGRPAKNYSLDEICIDLSEEIKRKITEKDIMQELSKHNVNFSFVKSKDGSENKFKILMKDAHIFESISSKLEKKVKNKTKNTMQLKNFKIKDLMNKTYNGQGQNVYKREKYKDINKEQGISR